MRPVAARPLGGVLADPTCDPTTLRVAVHARLPTCPAPSSVARAPRQVFRAVTRCEMEVGCGGFAQLFTNARGWFRVGPAALSALGQKDAAALVREAWKVASTERWPPGTPYTTYAENTQLRRFDDDGYRLLQQAIGAPLVAFVRAHEDDFTELDLG